MIFVTVGTTPFPFFRMDAVVQSLITTRNNNEKIVYQYGVTTHVKQTTNVFLYAILPYHIIQRYIRQARVVITHGGPATIYQVLGSGKIPYVIPRERRYGEHVNDHQLYFCQELSKREEIILLPSVRVSARTNVGKKMINRGKSSSLKQLIGYLHNITV